MEEESVEGGEGREEMRGERRDGEREFVLCSRKQKVKSSHMHSSAWKLWLSTAKSSMRSES